MTELYLAKSGYREITREATEPEWDRDDTHTSWNFGPIYLNKNQSYGSERFITDFDVKAGDVVYVVVAIWSTGDSFGHDDAAESEVFGCFKTYKEADDFKTVLKSIDTESYEFEIDIGGRKIYVPWVGYFESLDYITIVSGVVT